MGSDVKHPSQDHTCPKGSHGSLRAYLEVLKCVTGSNVQLYTVIAERENKMLLPIIFKCVTRGNLMAREEAIVLLRGNLRFVALLLVSIERI